MNETLSKIVNHPYRNHVIVGVASFIGGGVGGFLVAKRKYDIYEEYSFAEPQMTFDFDHISAETEVEVEEKSDRPMFIIDAEVLESRDAVVDLEVISETEIIIEDQTVSPEQIRQSIFAETDDEWDYVAEVSSRSNLKPYIVHKDEFFGEEVDYNQLTLNYYAGDDIMTDAEESPLYNYRQIVGELRFGHGSGDPKVVYVRNDKLKTEYEILHNEGLYSVEVLGMEIEDNARARDLRHSARPMKFRED